MQRARVGGDGEFRFVDIHTLFALMVNYAARIQHEQVLGSHAQRFEKLAGGDGAGARAVNHDFDLAHVLAGDLQRVEQRRAGNDRRAVLIVVENGNIQFFDEPLFNFEAFRRLDIFQVNAAKGGRQRLADLDNFIRAARSDLDIKDIDIGELLKEHALSFHHRLRRQRTAIAQAQDGAAIGDDGDQVGAGGQLEDGERILVDLQHRFRHARRIGQREV